MSKEAREHFLDTVKSIVCTDRNGQYGEPEDNFGVIAELWNTYLSQLKPRTIAPHDVAIMLALLKVARLKANPGDADSWKDLAGYAACGYGCIERRAELHKAEPAEDQTAQEMSAFGFLRKYNRICNACRIKGDVTCDECPILEARRATSQTCAGFMRQHPEETIAIVEKWAKEHPEEG